MSVDCADVVKQLGILLINQLFSCLRSVSSPRSSWQRRNNSDLGEEKNGVILILARFISLYSSVENKLCGSGKFYKKDFLQLYLGNTLS